MDWFSGCLKISIILCVFFLLIAGCVTLPPTKNITGYLPSIFTSPVRIQVDPFIGTWIRTYYIGDRNNDSNSKVSCKYQFFSSGNFSSSCIGTYIGAPRPMYGKWKNLGNNSYTAMYPNYYHPEQPYGFYITSYHNFSYNPEFDTLTDTTPDWINQPDRNVLVRLKNPK